VELREYFKILRKNLGLIIVATILVAFFTYLFTLRQPTLYESNANLTIIPQSKTELKNVYEYGGYYELQTATLFGSTIASWLCSPDIVAEIYQKAGYEIKNRTSKALSKLIKTTFIPSSFSIKLQLKDEDKNKAQKLTRATIETIQNKTAEFNQKAEIKTNFEVVAAEPVILENRPKEGFSTAIGALAGLVLGIFLAFIAEYSKKS